MMIELVKAWHGFPVGTRLESLGRGVAQILVERGLAREISTGNCDRADSGTSDVERGQKATRNRKQRHKP